MKKGFAIALSLLLVFGIVTGVFYWAGFTTEAPSLTQLRKFAFVLNSFNLANYIESKAQEMQLLRRVMQDWGGNLFDVVHPNYTESTPISEMWIVDESRPNGGYTLYTQYIKFFDGDTNEEEFRYKIQSEDRKEVIDGETFITMPYMFSNTFHEVDDGDTNLGIKSFLRAIFNLLSLVFQVIIIIAFFLSRVWPLFLGGALDLLKWVLRMLLFIITGNVPTWL